MFLQRISKTPLVLVCILLVSLSQYLVIVSSNCWQPLEQYNAPEALCTPPVREPPIRKMEVTGAISSTFSMTQVSNTANIGPNKKKVIILTVAKNVESWGKNRTFLSYLEMVQQFEYSSDLISIGLLIADKDEYNRMKEVAEKEFSQRFPYHSVKIMYKPDDGSVVSRAQRHADAAQKERRKLIARLRNELLMSFLEDNDAVLWIDADMVYIPSTLLLDMVESGKDIIAPRCDTPERSNYDANTWVGTRQKPNSSQWKVIKANGIYVPGPSFEMKWLTDFENDERQFVEIDSVGGTVLFVKAQVHKAGAIFPAMYLVGTDWEHEGYDGIETEGLCYMAKYLGYKCWGMSHEIVIHESDE